MHDNLKWSVGPWRPHKEEWVEAERVEKGDRPIPTPSLTWKRPSLSFWVDLRNLRRGSPGKYQHVSSGVAETRVGTSDVSQTRQPPPLFMGLRTPRGTPEEGTRVSSRTHCRSEPEACVAPSLFLSSSPSPPPTVRPCFRLCPSLFPSLFREEQCWTPNFFLHETVGTSGISLWEASRPVSRPEKWNVWCGARVHTLGVGHARRPGLRRRWIRTYLSQPLPFLVSVSRRRFKPSFVKRKT